MIDPLELQALRISVQGLLQGNESEWSEEQTFLARCNIFLGNVQASLVHLQNERDGWKQVARALAEPLKEMIESPEDDHDARHSVGPKALEMYREAS